MGSAMPLLSQWKKRLIPLNHIRPVGDHPDLPVENEPGALPVENEPGAGISLIELEKLKKVPEIPKVGNISLSSASSSSPPREAAAAIAGTIGTTGPSASPPRTDVDISKPDLAIMACSISLVVPVALDFKDLTSSWDTPWKELYGVLTIVSLASTVTGLFTAWWRPAVSWGGKLSPTLARFGLVDASALFIVFVACKLGHLGWAAGVAAAALVVLVLVVVWAWIEWPATGGAEAEVAAAVLQDGAGLPHGVP